MDLFHRFPSAAAFGCGLSYVAGVYLEWILPPRSFWATLPFLYYVFMVCLYGPSSLFRVRLRKEMVLGLTVGIWVGLYAIGGVNYERARSYQGMERKEIRCVEGILQTDGFRKGNWVILSIQTQMVEDGRGNRHSARFELTVIARVTGICLAGDRIRVRGSFGSDGEKSFLGDLHTPVVILHRPIVAFLRNELLRNIFREEGEQTALLQALCFGRKDELEVELGEAFRKAGTSHILALSGMHVGILVLLLQVLLRPLFKPLTLKVVIVFFLSIYCVLVGPFPSLVRAVLMYSIYTGASLLGRRIHPLDILSHAFVLSCLLFPRTVLSYSSILSYTAVGGILLFTRPLQRYFRRYLFEPLLSAVSVSLSAQLVTAPLTLCLFSRLPLFGWIASILLSPLISLFMWIGILSIPFHSFPLLNPYLQGILKFLYILIRYVAEMFAQAPAIQIP